PAPLSPAARPRPAPSARARPQRLGNSGSAAEEVRRAGPRGLRRGQAVTEAAMLGLASAVLNETVPPAEVCHIVHMLSAGTQEEMLKAYREAHADDAPAAVKCLVDNQGVKEVMNRLTEDFVLMALVAEGGPPRRCYSCASADPPPLRSRRPGPPRARPSRYVRLAKPVAFWRPARVLASLGWTPTRIRFPVPAAENTASFHFEVHAPPGVEI